MNQTCDGLGMSIFSLGRLLGAKSYRKDHRSAGDSPFSFSEQIKHLAKFPIIHAPSFVISSFGNIGEVYVKEIRYFIQLEYSAKEQVREEIFWGEL